MLRAIAIKATTIARRIWLQNHIRKPTTQLTKQIARSVTQCYDGTKEEKCQILNTHHDIPSARKSTNTNITDI